MRTSVFEFTLRIAPADLAAVESAVRNALQPLAGVDEVTFAEHFHLRKLFVKASFANGKVAEALHRKIMKALIKTECLTILEVRTQITEIYGEPNGS